MDDSLLGSEFARVLQASRTHTPRRHHRQPPAAPPPLLASPCLLSPKHHLALFSPPTSPVSGDSPLPRFAAVDVPSLIPRQETRYLTSSNSAIQHSPFPAPTQPGPSGTPPTLQPDPTCLAQTPMSRTTAQVAAPCCGPLRLGFRLTPSAVVSETQPVTPAASSEQDHEWSCGAIHPAVNAMTALSDPHPLNILADISSVAPKSPVKWVQAVRASSHLNVQKTIAKSAGIGKGGAGAAGNLYLGRSTAATAGNRTAASTGKSSTLSASKCKSPKRGAAGGNDGPSGSLPKGSEPSSKPTITCSQCSSSFTERFNLNKHIRAVHERRRPYQCQTCLARFQQRDHMQKHEMCVHKKLRQFSCDACGASFGWRGVLKKHRKSVHGIHE